MNNEITEIRGDALSRKLADRAIAFGTLAQRFAEASRSVRKATQRERSVVRTALAEALRLAGDACHEYARDLESD